MEKAEQPQEAPLSWVKGAVHLSPSGATLYSVLEAPRPLSWALAPGVLSGSPENPRPASTPSSVSHRPLLSHRCGAVSQLWHGSGLAGLIPQVSRLWHGDKYSVKKTGSPHRSGSRCPSLGQPGFFEFPKLDCGPANYFADQPPSRWCPKWMVSILDTFAFLNFFNSFLKIVCSECFAYIYVCVHKDQKRTSYLWNWSYGRLGATIFMLGNRAPSCARTTNALNLWAISSAPSFAVYKLRSGTKAA